MNSKTLLAALLRLTLGGLPTSIMTFREPQPNRQGVPLRMFKESINKVLSKFGIGVYRLNGKYTQKTGLSPSTPARFVETHASGRHICVAFDRVMESIHTSNGAFTRHCCHQPRQ